MKGESSGKGSLTTLYTLLSLAFISMICINVYAYVAVTNLSEMYANLNNAAMTFKLKVLNANLLFREIVTGYTSKDMNEVWKLIEDAKSYGSKISDIEPELKLLDKISDYRATVLECYKARELQNPSQELRKKYDKGVAIMLDSIDAFESRLKDKIAVKLNLVKMLYMALIANILLIFGFVIFLFWRYSAQRTRAEEEMLSAHANLNSLLNTLDSMLITVDPKGVITQWNNKAELYFKQSALMAGRTIFNVIPFMKEYQAQIEAVFHSRKSKEHYREKIKLENGKERFFNIVFTPVTQAGKGVSGILIRVDDVTSQEMHEEQMRQSQKMEVVENLIGGLANDFNNVLGAITGTISMLRFSLDNKGSIEEVKNNVEVIESSAERAVVMVQQLQMMVQRQKSEMAPMDVNGAVMHVLKICQNTFDKRIQLEANLYSVKAIAKADPVQLSLILLNLCDNAAQAMTSMRQQGEQQGGTLLVAVDRICPDKAFRTAHPMAAENSYWIISIKDTGIGMDKDTLSKIFDPFFTTKPHGEGSGLGLTLVNETIKAHGGFIEVESTPGEGTTFSIYLPEYVSHVRPGQNETVRQTSGEAKIPIGSGLIFVVDDEAIMRKTAKNILEKLGYQVVTAEDGEEAVNIYKEKHGEIKAVLLDMAMPKMSGKEAYVEMKKTNPEIKSLLVSGFKKDERIQATLDLGVNGFVQKPYTMQVLAQEIKRILAA